eukprot:XP_011666556.1 PREDICTED: fibroblast growth factor receptor 2 isoform X1 [Strongylocentrotus purpuratus]
MARIYSTVAHIVALLIVISCIHRTKAQCGRPTLADNSVFITPSQGTYDVGSVVTFSCFDGDDVYGPTSSSCQNDGTWDLTSEPLCTYCERPIVSNPYAIMLSPDQEAYLRIDSLDISCEEEHTSSTLPRNFACQFDEIWYPDPSNYLCFAQCDTTKLLDNDVIAEKPNNGGPQTVFNHGDTANFNCQGARRFTGQNTATCVNGSFDFNTKPECLDPCPVSQQNLSDSGLSYSIVEDPVINETQTLYYRDGASIMFSCRDGYIPGHCQGVCHDGSWDPGDFPSCIALGDHLTTGAAVGISILTILLVASIIINIGFFIFLERARSKDADMEPSSYKFNKNGSVEHVMNNNGHNSERLYASLRFGPAKSSFPASARKRVTFLTKLGSLGLGDFGEAWKGEFRSTQETVLIRRVPDDAVRAKDILARVKAFSQLTDHPNIVKCFGYHQDQNIILYKFISGGTLLTHLQMKRGQAQPTYMAYNTTKPQRAPVDEVGLINFALQIAKGMQFLASEKIIHGALCAHNVLLDEQNMCKVSDYGMAQTMFDKRIRPSRWNSPETTLDGVFSSEADVWSFGIVLWEIMSLGGRPYPDLELDDIGKEIANGYKMPRPPHCKNELYTIMSRCWERDGRNRLSIDGIVTNLDQILVQTQDSLNYLLLSDLDNDTYHAYSTVD